MKQKKKLIYQFPKLFIHIVQDKNKLYSDLGKLNINNKEIENESKLKNDINILNKKYLEVKIY